MLPQPPRRPTNLRLLFATLFVLHALLLCFDYGRLPPAPVLGDEVIINDPSVSLALGHGFRAESLPGSRFLLDRYYAQFPPVYLLAEATAIRVFGLSVYSLRSVTLLADLASLAVFLAGLLALVRWRLADPRHTLAIALFAAVNPASIVMSRTARPDSTVYFFATVGFLLLIHALYRQHREAPAHFSTLLLGALAIGLALATHLEAIPIVVTAGIVILAAVSATPIQKLTALAVIPLTFLAVCAATFGNKLLLAYRQWQAIVHLDDKIQPGILNQLRIVRENPRSGGLIFLVVAEAVLLMVAIPLLAAWQRRDHAAAHTPRHRLTLGFAISSVLCLLLMQFVIPGSGHRYVILLPGLLFGLAVALPLSTTSKLPTAASLAFAIVSLAVLALYFRSDRHHDPALSPHRYDTLVDNILATTPPGGRIATTPGLWLAFRQRGIPITLIYDPGFDATTPYHDQGPGSLDPFSTIVLSEDDKNYASNAPRLQTLPGTLTTTQVGKEALAIFHRTP